ncbi:MAG: glycosyltransferase, partial [Candidatus Eisenbacteria bacterium]|nr:glycosyltransferase [Candidatus Eisenbacteria bacterium]
MRVLYISEVQWLSQISRKHQFVRRFPNDWDVLFLSPINTSAAENSVRERTDTRYPHVRYASLPLPKPDSTIAPVRALTGALSSTGLRALLSRVRSFEPDIVVCSYIWAAPVIPRIRELGSPIIYDCNDLHTEFYPACPDAAERVFRSLVVDATEVVSSSARLHEVCGRGTVVGNGVDLGTFTGCSEGPLPALIAESPVGDCTQMVAYVGSIDDRIDFDVLGALAGALSHLETRTGIVCIGRVFGGVREKTEALAGKHPDHIVFTGRVAYEELPTYLSHATVGIAPFVLDERTRAINPNKLYMYAAMEQNIVSTPFSADIREHSDLIFIADDPGSFASAVERAL